MPTHEYTPPEIAPTIELSTDQVACMEALGLSVIWYIVSFREFRADRPDGLHQVRILHTKGDVQHGMTLHESMEALLESLSLKRNAEGIAIV